MGECVAILTRALQVLPEELERKGLGEQARDGSFIWGFEALQYWDTIHEGLVKKYVDLYYSDDAAVEADKSLQGFFDNLRGLWAPLNAHMQKPFPAEHKTKAALVDYITHHIFHVTGLHEQIHLSDHLIEHDVIAAFLSDGDLKDLQSLQPTMEDRLLEIFIYTIVDLPAPPMCQGVNKYLLDDDARKIFEEYLEGLDHQHAEVVRRNRNREEEIWTFDPWVLGAAVTV